MDTIVVHGERYVVGKKAQSKIRTTYGTWDKLIYNNVHSHEVKKKIRITKRKSKSSS